MPKMKFKSKVTWTGHSVSSDAVSGAHTLRIDEPKYLGGEDTGSNPVELILSALGGCLIVLVNAFAPAHDVEVRDVVVEVEGDLDPDGMFGKSDARRGFSEIRFNLKIDSPSSPKKIRELTQHVTDACPVKDTLSGVPVKAT
ncbi:MAG: OsmC family protein [Xanthomonadales bacterium]|nr:OsmC family protein [Xanthomonadales bacterium]